MDTSTVGFNGYLSNGLKVFYQFPIVDLEAMALVAANYDDLFELTNVLLAKGLSLHEPSVGELEAGEKTDSVGWVLRYDKENKRGTMSHWIGLYPANEAATKKYLWAYLDDEDDIKAFEDATGLKVTDMKVWPTNQAPERTAAMADFIYKVKPGVNAIYKLNPDYIDEVKTKFEPKRIFVRWAAPLPTPPPPAVVTASAGVGIPSVKVDPRFPDAEAERAFYAQQEIEARRKAATDLVNEAVTIYKVTYKPTRNGMGVPHWEALAHDINNTSLPIEVGELGADIIRRAGYDWPTTDGDNLAIEVITEMVNGKRRIKSALKPEGTDTAVSLEEVLQRLPDATTWVFDRVALLTALSNDNRVNKISYQERANAVDKMLTENAYEAVATVGGALELTVSRLQSHRKEKQLPQAAGQ